METQQPALTIHVFNNEDSLGQIFSFTSGLRELSILVTVSQKWKRSIHNNWGELLAKTVEKNMKNIASGIEMVGDIGSLLNNILHGYDYRISGSLCLRAIIDEHWYKTISERVGTDLDIFIRVTSISEAHFIIESFFKHFQIDDDGEDDGDIKKLTVADDGKVNLKASAGSKTTSADHEAESDGELAHVDDEDDGDATDIDEEDLLAYLKDIYNELKGKVRT